MSRRAGLTLVEVTLALAITALLAVGVLEVITACTRGDRLDRRWQTSVQRQAALAELLTTDLSHARRVMKTAMGFQLDSRAALDAQTMELEHLPSTVVYEVRKIGSRTWLSRTQQLTDQAPSRELVAAGPKTLEIAAVGGRDLPAGRWTSMPEAVTVTFTWDGADPVIVSFRRK